MTEQKLSPNSLAFIALTNEYCHTLENASSLSKTVFANNMAKLLPRIYISALDIKEGLNITENGIMAALEEEQYDTVRNSVALVMGEDDIYLEVFEEDMQYSDTPIAASVSENLADLYQEFFNLVASLHDLPTTTQQELLEQCRDNFNQYWSQTLCNVLRAINKVLTQEQDY